MARCRRAFLAALAIAGACYAIALGAYGVLASRRVKLLGTERAYQTAMLADFDRGADALRAHTGEPHAAFCSRTAAARRDFVSRWLTTRTWHGQPVISRAGAATILLGEMEDAYSDGCVRAADVLRFAGTARDVMRSDIARMQHSRLEAWALALPVPALGYSTSAIAYEQAGLDLTTDHRVAAAMCMHDRLHAGVVVSAALATCYGPVGAK